MSNTKLWVTLIACLGASCLVGQVTIDFTKTPDDGGTPTYILDETKDAYKLVTGTQAFQYNVALSQAVYVVPNTTDTTLMLYAGDTNGDGVIRYQGGASDVLDIFIDVLSYDNVETGESNSSGSLSYDNATGYMETDVNLDGKAKYQGGESDVLEIFLNLLSYPINTNLSASYANHFEQIPTQN